MNGLKRKIFLSLAIIAVLVFAGGYLYTGPAMADEEAEESESGWETRAEKSFGIGHGLGRKLMTEDEWKEHQQKMRTMTSEEKIEYRRKVHEELRERAAEKGIKMPEKPMRSHEMDRPSKKGMGKGMGGGKSGY